MHIAHLRDGEFGSGPQLAGLVGLKPRQIANLARDGKIPGAFRPNGRQFQYRITPELLEWIQWKRNRVKQSKQPQCRKYSLRTLERQKGFGLNSMHGIRADFDNWSRRVGGSDGILKMEPECIEEIIGELQPIARLLDRLKGALEARKRSK